MNHALEISNLFFKYGKTSIINNVNLEVPESSVFGFLGLNGAGKSTLIKLILGLLAGKGSIRIYGTDIKRNRIQALTNIGSFVEGPSLYPDMNVLNYMRIKQTLLNLHISSIERALEIVDLKVYKNVKLKDLSLGLKQRVCLAFALLGDPSLLILDEPTNGLDPDGIKDIRDLILNLNKEHGKTIFMSSHILNEIERTCSHIAIIDKGAIVLNESLVDIRSGFKSIIEFHVDNIHEAERIIRRLGYASVFISNNNLEVHISDSNETAAINKALVLENIDVFSINQKNNLEDIFFKYTYNGK